MPVPFAGHQGRLLTLAVPRYFPTIDSAKETILADNLHNVREVIDQFYADRGRYPDSLDQLAEKKYLRSLPVDPITERTGTWLLIPPEDASKGNLYGHPDRLAQQSNESNMADGRCQRDLDQAGRDAIDLGQPRDLDLAGSVWRHFAGLGKGAGRRQVLGFAVRGRRHQRPVGRAPLG